MSDNDRRFADLAMKAANQRTHQMIEIAELKERIAALTAAARAVVDEYASHDVMCAICDPDWPGATPPSCSCGFDAAYNQLAALLGVPVGRLPVEVGKAAALGLDVARMALGEQA